MSIRVTRENFFKCVFKCLLACVILTIPRIFVYKIFGSGWIDTTTTYVSITLIMFFICFIMVKDEERIKE